MRNLIVSVLALLPATMLLPSIVCARTATDQELSSPEKYSDEFLNALPKDQVPLTLIASFELRAIDFIDDEAETFEFTGVLKLSWHDPRLAFDPGTEGIGEKLYMGDYQFNEVYTGWWPQAVLVNENGMYDKHGVLLRVLPDGSLTLLETVNAVAKTHLNLRRFPFDKQRLEAVFEVLGFDDNEVVLRGPSAAEGAVLNLGKVFHVPQWHLTGISATTADRKIPLSGHEATSSTFVVRMDMQRKSYFILRLVILPVLIIVMLSWSVFWMDKSSVGDRMDISFIGILTVVAYQLVLSDILPHISYLTLATAFLNISFLIMCSNVIINLRVSFLDRQGKSVEGDQLDRRCRLIL
jgi:hypothetical protein